MNMQFVVYNDCVYEGCFDVFTVIVNTASTIFSLTHFTIKGLYCLVFPK